MFFGIVAGVDTDKETESITVDQIAGKNGITSFLRPLKVHRCWR